MENEQDQNEQKQEDINVQPPAPSDVDKTSDKQDEGNHPYSVILLGLVSAILTMPLFMLLVLTLI